MTNNGKSNRTKQKRNVWLSDCSKIYKSWECHKNYRSNSAKSTIILIHCSPFVIFTAATMLWTLLKRNSFYVYQISEECFLSFTFSSGQRRKLCLFICFSNKKIFSHIFAIQTEKETLISFCTLVRVNSITYLFWRKMWAPLFDRPPIQFSVYRVMNLIDPFLIFEWLLSLFFVANVDFSSMFLVYFEVDNS